MPRLHGEASWVGETEIEIFKHEEGYIKERASALVAGNRGNQANTEIRKGLPEEMTFTTVASSLYCEEEVVLWEIKWNY